MNYIKVVILTLISVLSLNCQAATSLDWGTDGAIGLGSGPDLFGTDLNPLNQTTGIGYVLKLYVYTGSGSPVTDANPLIDTFIIASNYIGSSGDDTAAIFLTNIADIGPAGLNLSGLKIYTAIWDPTGTMYHVLPAAKTITTLDGTTGDPPSISYNAGIQAATAYTVAVPEPSTVGLLLVGAGLVGLRRFRKA